MAISTAWNVPPSIFTADRPMTVPFTTRADIVTARPNGTVWNATLLARAGAANESGKTRAIAIEAIAP